MQQKEPPKPKQETRQALPGKSFFEDLEKPNNPEMVKKLEAAIGSYYDRMRDETKVREALESSETEDESAFALKRLRPREYREAEDRGKTLSFQNVIDQETKKQERMKYQN